MMKNAIVLILLVASWCPAFSQQVADFSLTNVLNGETVSLDTYPSCQGLVIIFTSNNCPYDEHYRKRIRELATTYHSSVPVLLVNSNTEPAENAETMKRKAQQLDLAVPYLADKQQSLMHQLGATKTPQAFLLKNNNGQFTVVYNGAIDDNAQVEADVRQAYLKDAIDIMLSNQTVKTSEIRPVGCTIRRK
jgi:peroxiredoxin